MAMQASTTRRGLLAGGAAAAVAGAALGTARRSAAQRGGGEAVRIGLILPMTGPFASTGRQVEAAVRAYLGANGETFGGRRVELLVRDDTGVAPDITRRLAQELVVRERVRFLAGFGLTPLALAAAPIATEAKVPMVVMAAATSIIVQRSPYILRTSFTLPQATVPIADWAARNGIRNCATLVSDYAPGLDAERAFKERFTAAGGRVPLELRAPLRNPDFAPFLQRVHDAKPEALFIFVPSGEGAAAMKQFAERGLREAGIRLIGTGDLTDDDILNDMGEPAIGVVTSHHYSAAHDSAENRAFLAAYRRVAPDVRPNFMAVGGWDGMHLIAEGLKRAGGGASGDQLLAAMKGLSWTSPRGPITIDANTRDIVQDIYIRRVERRDGQLWNIEFDRIAQVRDPGT
ncbi:MAG: ABC transporter substrate-binding protein [Acetobacteraceae bacterium]|nr:ABC transporter substrate-binding protein [Acetobacteraceae bacterium]